MALLAPVALAHAYIYIYGTTALLSVELAITQVPRHWAVAVPPGNPCTSIPLKASAGLARQVLPTFLLRLPLTVGSGPGATIFVSFLPCSIIPLVLP